VLRAPLLAQEVARQTGDVIELFNGSSVEVREVCYVQHRFGPPFISALMFI
jgi:hypothetical protein